MLHLEFSNTNNNYKWLLLSSFLMVSYIANLSSLISSNFFSPSSLFCFSIYRYFQQAITSDQEKKELSSTPNNNINVKIELDGRK